MVEAERKFMPLAKLSERKREAVERVERQAPEPRNRMVRREMVHERRVTKRTLREMIDGRERDWTPAHICD